MDQELELLRSMPPEGDGGGDAVDEGRDERSRKKTDEDMWKLDAPRPSAQGPLLDPQGKVEPRPSLVPYN
jgi:hypothetical protein